MYWDYEPFDKFKFVREATADDMKRKDWKGDGLKSQSLILPTPEVAEDEVTREDLKDIVRKGNYENVMKQPSSNSSKRRRSFSRGQRQIFARL
jgi:hypothetical protein